MASGLLDKANIILTPTGYKAGTMYNVAPIEQPYEDFVFSRASVASRVNSSGLVEMVGRTLGSNLVLNGDFEELGDEISNDIGFDNPSNWALTGQSTVSNGKAHILQDDSSNTGITANTTIINKTYKITGVISDYVSGSVGFASLGSTTPRVAIPSQNGAFTIYYTSSRSTPSTWNIQRISSPCDLKIDNVSVKQVDPNDYWNLGAGWSLGDGIAEANNTSTFIEQSGLIEASKLYRLTFQARLKSGTNGTINAYIGGSNNKQFTISDTNWQSFTYINTRGSSIATSIYFNNNGTELELDNVSVQEIIDTNNIPRINYDSNGENGHWLLEPTSTNLVPYSEDFENGYTKVNSSVDLNDAVAPDGTTTANKFNSTATGSSISKSNANSSALFHTVSIFLKKGTIDIVTLTVTGGSPAISASTTVNLTSGTITASSGNGSITPTITNFGNDWYRITASSTSNGNVANPTISIVNSSTTASGYFYMWGLQFEGLSYATSYIPTLTGSTETRATETATGAGSADLINSTEGVLYAEIATLVNGGANRYISLSDNTTSNRLNVIFSSNTDRLTISGVGNIGSFTNINFFSYTQNVYNKIAIKYSSSGVKLFVNGSLEGSNSDNVSWTSNTLTTLDFSLWNQSTAPFEGKVKALAVFNTALTDAELTELTS